MIDVSKMRAGTEIRGINYADYSEVPSYYYYAGCVKDAGGREGVLCCTVRDEAVRIAKALRSGYPERLTLKEVIWPSGTGSGTVHFDSKERFFSAKDDGIYDLPEFKERAEKAKQGEHEVHVRKESHVRMLRRHFNDEALASMQSGTPLVVLDKDNKVSLQYFIAGESSRSFFTDDLTVTDDYNDDKFLIAGSKDESLLASRLYREGQFEELFSLPGVRQISKSDIDLDGSTSKPYMNSLKKSIEKQRRRQTFDMPKKDNAQDEKSGESGKEGSGNASYVRKGPYKKPVKTFGEKQNEQHDRSRKDFSQESCSGSRHKTGSKQAGKSFDKAAGGMTEEDIRRIMQETMADYMKKHETPEAVDDLRKGNDGKDAKGKGDKGAGRSPVNINIQDEMRRVMVRQMCMQMLQSATSGSLAETAAYVGGAFLVLRHCGGIKENLRDVFNLPEGMFEKGPFKKFADRCKQTGPNDRIPYDPTTAALDSVGMDLAFHKSLTTPGNTPEGAVMAEQAWYARQADIGRRLAQDGLSEGPGFDMFKRERQKAVCSAILEDPSRAAFYGIEIGDDNWNEIVKQCKADVRITPPNPKNLSEIDVKVASYEMPNAGVCKKDGTPWFDGKEGRVLKIATPVITDDEANFYMQEHRAALKSWCGRQETTAILQGLQIRPPMSATQVQKDALVRYRSRVDIMKEQGFSANEIRDMWEDHVNDVFDLGGHHHYADKSAKPAREREVYDGVDPGVSRGFEQAEQDADAKRHGAQTRRTMDQMEESASIRAERAAKDILEHDGMSAETDKQGPGVA